MVEGWLCPHFFRLLFGGLKFRDISKFILFFTVFLGDLEGTGTIKPPTIRVKQKNVGA